MPPRLYGELAEWWPLLSPPDEYAAEAVLYAELLRAGRDAATVLTALELGSGGGHCASQMQKGFRWTLSDLSPSMLAQSRKLNPTAEHVEGDMRTLRLGRAFDAVFVHDAVAYLTTEPDLEAACRTAFEHTAPGGTALFVPDCVRETFTPGTDSGGTDDGGSDAGDRGLRYFEWQHAPADGGTVAEIDMVLLLRERDRTRVVHDRHTVGVFPRATWLALLDGAGFSVTERTAEPGDRPLFVAYRASA